MNGKISGLGTVSVITERNAKTIVFGHEIGHNFGLNHDYEPNLNQYPYGRSYSFGQGAQRRNTIMYSAFSKNYFLNQYSNPNVLSNGEQTVVKGQADSARVLTYLRFSFANIREESEEETGTGPEAQNCVAKTSQGFSTCYVGLAGRFNSEGCRQECSRRSDCMSWHHYGQYCWLQAYDPKRFDE